MKKGKPKVRKEKSGEFISASGSRYKNLAEYKSVKAKRPNSKYSKAYEALEKVSPNSIPKDGLIFKVSKLGLEYLAPNLVSFIVNKVLTNKDKLRAIKPIVKSFTKNNGGSTSGLIEITLIRK